MIVRYRLFLVLLSLPITLLFIWQALKQRNFKFLKERLGFISTQLKDPLWFHATSVGEINAIAPLIKHIQQQQPEMAILITTTTPTGAAIARRLFPDIEHHYFPFDFLINVSRTIKSVNPKALMIVETEIWPNLYAACGRLNIPLYVVNGRLSDRTVKTTLWIHRLYRQALTHVNHIYCRSADDKSMFELMGANETQLTVAGNLKYAAIIDNNAQPISETERPYILAASTRDSEEPIITNAFMQAELKEMLLVIAPRHPDRLNEIIHSLDRYKIAIRSHGDAITNETEIYIADTIGEMAALISGAKLVIIGGSFVDKGGQNLLEPAAAGKPTIVGPHMENFKTETEDLLKAKGVVQVTAENLPDEINRLINDKEAVSELVTNAKGFVDERKNVVEDYYQLIMARLQG